MKNNGKPAEDAFEAHWDGVGHVERLRDKKDLMGLNKGAHVADFAKPSDFMVSAPNVPLHYAEVKSTNATDRFGFGDIRPAQSAAALKEASRGSGSYVFYIWSYQHHKWFVMDCHQYAALVGEGRRSVKFEELAEWQK